MKNQIDQLVREIYISLEQPALTPHELDAVLNALGIIGIPRAIKLRQILESYADDWQLTKEDQLYAKAQIDSLPDF